MPNLIENLNLLLNFDFASLSKMSIKYIIYTFKASSARFLLNISCINLALIHKEKFEFETVLGSHFIISYTRFSTGSLYILEKLSQQALKVLCEHCSTKSFATVGDSSVTVLINSSTSCLFKNFP